MVEQEAVNFEVAGSSPVPGAILDNKSNFFMSKIWYNMGVVFVGPGWEVIIWPIRTSHF